MIDKHNCRLIDESKLISDLRECIGCKRQDNMPSDYFKLSELEFLISTQSTAYDVNKVLKQLRDCIDHTHQLFINDEINTEVAIERETCYVESINYVKGGKYETKNLG